MVTVTGPSAYVTMRPVCVTALTTHTAGTASSVSTTTTDNHGQHCHWLHSVN